MYKERFSIMSVVANNSFDPLTCCLSAVVMSQQTRLSGVNSGPYNSTLHDVLCIFWSPEEFEKMTTICLMQPQTDICKLNILCSLLCTVAKKKEAIVEWKGLTDSCQRWL